jgi:hypothetical protein
MAKQREGRKARVRVRTFKVESRELSRSAGISAREAKKLLIDAINSIPDRDLTASTSAGSGFRHGQITIVS